MVGEEVQRFNCCDPRCCNEAGNEADGENGELGRDCNEEAVERRMSFNGGVGGVDIHVGGEHSTRSKELEVVEDRSPSISEMGVPSTGK